MPMKKIAILQSNYIPWKGYFDMISQVDEFVLYDSAQFTKNDWRNRNKIKTQDGVKWLTIPVKHSISNRISEIEVVNDQWRKKHWNTLKQSYAKSKWFHAYQDNFGRLYESLNETRLSRINYAFIAEINGILGIKTRITWSTDYELTGDRSEKLLNICKQAGASEYVSGPAARDYLDEGLFARENIKVTWMDYSGYKEYGQLHPPFEHGVSIVDLIFNEGPDARKHMKSHT